MKLGGIHTSVMCNWSAQTDVASFLRALAGVLDKAAVEAGIRVDVEPVGSIGADRATLLVVSRHGRRMGSAMVLSMEPVVGDQPFGLGSRTEGA